MKRLTRLALLIIACTVFFVTAPLIVLYAIGYRINPLSGTTSPVGVLLVNTAPRGATVAVNDLEIGKTPRAIPNLAPGLVTVTLSKDGYRTWKKQIPIEPTRASDFQHIRLFPSTPIIDRLTSGIQDFTLSPNEQLLALIMPRNTIRIIDTTGQGVVESVRLTATPLKITWSSDSTEVLVQTKDRFFLLDLRNPKPVALSDLPGGKILGWDARIPDRLIILTDEHSLVAFSTVNQAVTPLIADVDMATLGSSSIYAVANDTLYEYSYDGTLRQTFSAALPTLPKKLLASSAGTVAAIDADGHVVVISTAGLQEVPALSALDLGFSPDGSMLWIQTAANELYIYNANNELVPYLAINSTQLVARLSRPIRHISWLGSNDYLLYQVDDELIVSETDTRDYTVANSLDTTNVGDAKAATDGSGQTMYYLKKEGATTTLVKMDLIGE